MVPRSWLNTTLEVVTQPKRTSVQPADYASLPFVGMEHVESETMRLLATIPASEMRSSALRFHAGDVLYGRLRPYLNKVLKPEFEGLCSPEFIVFPQSQQLVSGYLQYFLNSWRFKTFASRLNTGDRPRVDWDQLKVYAFPLPPLAEQRRIVAAIEEQFTRLDAGVAALKRAQAALKRYRAAVLKAAVEGKLTASWRIQHSDVQPASELLADILAERRAKWEADLRAKGKDPAKAKYEEPQSPQTEGLPELPQGWVWATVEQVSQFTRYGTSAKTNDERDGVPILRMGNIQDGTLDFTNLKYLPATHTEFPELLLQPGDLLFNRTNSAGLVGKSAVYHGIPSPCSFASYLIGVRFSPGCSSDYAGFALNSAHGREWVASVVVQQVGQANVNGSKLRSFRLPLPPRTEQEAIVATVEERISVIATLEATIAANLKRAERLRQAILERAFTGRLVPQDPNDEPASALLERIQKERLTGTKAEAAERQGAQHLAQPVALWDLE